MNIYEFPPIELLINAAYWVVTRLSELIEPFAGAQSAALAIILLTLVVRAALIPVGRSQVKANATRRRLAPELAELQRRHRKNPEVLQRKTMELYAREQASPFAGCLPALAQMPVLMAVYGLFILPRIDGHPNALLGHRFLGVPLDASLFGQLGAGALTVQSGLLFVAIVVVIAIVAQASRKLLMPEAGGGGAGSEGGAGAKGQATGRVQPAPAQPSSPGMPDLSGVTRVLSFMPFMTAVVAAFVPLAAALYLMTTTAWTLGERLILTRIYRAEE